MEKPDAGTPVTQEWIVSLVLGYFLVGPLILLAIAGLAWAVKSVIEALL